MCTVRAVTTYIFRMITQRAVAMLVSRERLAFPLPSRFALSIS